MNAQKELEYLREKAALLERCLEYERLLRDMREAAPREPVIVPAPYEVPRQPWERVTPDPYRYDDTQTWVSIGPSPYRATLWNENTYAMPCVGHGGVTIC